MSLKSEIKLYEELIIGILLFFYSTYLNKIKRFLLSQFIYRRLYIFYTYLL